MIDILLTAIDGDLLVKNGDFLFGESDEQNIHDLINDAPGEWKEFLNVGLGINYYLNSRMDKTSITQAVRIQLQNDGFNTDKMVLLFDNINSTEIIDLTGVSRI